MLKVESYKRGIVFSTVFNILNKGLVFLNGLLVAYYFGVKESTDFFFYVYNTILILGAFISSMNSSVLIPESMRLRAVEGERMAMKFLNFFIWAYFAVALSALFIVSLDPVSFFTTISNFGESQLYQHRRLLYLALPLFGLICLINLFVDILTSHKYFTVPMIVGILNGVSSILFVVLLHNSIGIESVFYGLLLSYLVNIILLGSLMKRKLHWQFGQVVFVKNRRVWGNYGFAQLGNVATTLSSYTPLYILSAYNTGIITALTFAQQISSLPTMLVTNQFSAVAGIKLNELYARGETKEIDRVFSESANFLHFLMIPLSCFIFFYSNEIVTFLLGFRSMSASTAAYVALFLKFLGFLLPLYVINTLLARLFMASHKIKESFWYQVLFNIVLIIALFGGVKYWGPVGYPIVIVGAYTINLAASWLIEKHYFGIVNYGKIMERFAVFFAVNLVVSSAVYFSLRDVDLPHPALKLILTFSVYLIVLLGVNQALGMNNVMASAWNDLINKAKEKTKS